MTPAVRNAYCPQCHRPLGSVRFGVILPTLKAAILDRIKSAGEVGISSDEIILTGETFRDRGQVSSGAIKSHVSQINELLSDTGWRIRSDRRRWTLVRERSSSR